MSERRSRPGGTPLSLVGLALRAGRLAVGAEAVAAALGRQRAHLVVMAHDLSEGSRRRVERETASVPTVRLGESMAAMGQALGRSPTGVVAILDPHLAKEIQRRHELADGGEGGPSGRLAR